MDYWNNLDDDEIERKYQIELAKHQSKMRKKEKEKITTQKIVKGKNEKYEINLKFQMDTIITPKRCVGTNTLYSANKENSYILLDIDKITNGNTWIVHMNNYRYAFAGKHTKISDKQISNNKFLISQFLTY